MVGTWGGGDKDQDDKGGHTIGYYLFLEGRAEDLCFYLGHLYHRCQQVLF